MRIFFGGGEKPSYRKALLSCDADAIAINLTNYNVPKTKEIDFDAVFGEASLALYTSVADEDHQRYERFVQQYADHFDLILGHPDSSYQEENWVPVWNDGEDIERFAWLCQKHRKVAVSDTALTDANLRRVKALVKRWEASAVVLSSKPSILTAVPWETAIVTSWTSVIRYGETQIWDGSELRRYPAQQKEVVRKKHRPQIARLGVDPDRVIEDEADAVSRLAILSWQSFASAQAGAYGPSLRVIQGEGEGSLEHDLATTASMLLHPASQDSEGVGVAIEGTQMRHEREPELLPILRRVSVDTPIGTGDVPAGEGEDQGVRQESHVRSTGVSARQCDSCYLAGVCPKFEPSANCGYNIPVEIKTKSQLNAVISALIEMQASRVMFAIFAEEMQGQGIDSAASAEMDRFFNVVQKSKDIADTRDTLRFEVEARASGGVIERLFGQRATEQMQALPNGGLSAPGTDRMLGEILGQQIVDAEVVETD